MGRGGRIFSWLSQELWKCWKVPVMTITLPCPRRLEIVGVACKYIYCGGSIIHIPVCVHMQWRLLEFCCRTYLVFGHNRSRVDWTSMYLDVHLVTRKIVTILSKVSSRAFGILGNNCCSNSCARNMCDYFLWSCCHQECGGWLWVCNRQM